ncbi:unnamed protein product [Vitrella brassicaformis CCMP3155]|uniref:J domain-containing protein n=1 Tax=Vitrella brassicaformis (strain CCMP3155) TaxID=1169540 RepID=A0A0G4FV96_VITBC|nr:unnamed protein product [Vitrella brassicaformis CCMP3155]|mmetsp:Transcript_20960/g.51098  ORF Transcript_20960/g.51098 Transcript_20960/m.51098 type:complete len:218 (-) Transcript_20960:341-994(-)|eukprot:CEM18848.1 unnamed protein product [Vitrella brassicaformis CCMP3155]
MSSLSPADALAALDLRLPTTPAHVRARFLQRAQECHPDKEGGSLAAFHKLKEAYEVARAHVEWRNSLPVWKLVSFKIKLPKPHELAMQYVMSEKAKEKKAAEDAASKKAKEEAAAAAQSDAKTAAEGKTKMAATKLVTGDASKEEEKKEEDNTHTKDEVEDAKPTPTTSSPTKPAASVPRVATCLSARHQQQRAEALAKREKLAKQKEKAAKHRFRP